MNNPTPTVFVVDDDDAVRQALMRLIRGAGYLVEDSAARARSSTAARLPSATPAWCSTCNSPI